MTSQDLNSGPADLMPHGFKERISITRLPIQAGHEHKQNKHYKILRGVTTPEAGDVERVVKVTGKLFL